MEVVVLLLFKNNEKRYHIVSCRAVCRSNIQFRSIFSNPKIHFICKWCNGTYMHKSRLRYTLLKVCLVGFCYLFFVWSWSKDLLYFWFHDNLWYCSRSSIVLLLSQLSLSLSRQSCWAFNYNCCWIDSVALHDELLAKLIDMKSLATA